MGGVGSHGSAASWPHPNRSTEEQFDEFTAGDDLGASAVPDSDRQYTRCPESKEREGVPKGTVHRHEGWAHSVVYSGTAHWAITPSTPTPRFACPLSHSLATSIADPCACWVLLSTAQAPGATSRSTFRRSRTRS